MNLLQRSMLRRERTAGLLFGPILALAGLSWGILGCPAPNPLDPEILRPSPPEELPDLAGRIVRIGLLADRLPFSQFDSATGAFRGFDRDLFDLMAARLNFTPDYSAAVADSLFDDVGAGRFDVAGGGIPYDLGRVDDYDFAAPYAQVKRRLVVRTTDDRAATITAFQANAVFSVGVVDGQAAAIAAEFFGPARVREFDEFAAAADALVAGELDGLLLGDADLALQQSRLPGALVALPGLVGGNIIALVLPDQSELTDALNGAFLQLVAEGELDALREVWGL